MISVRSLRARWATLPWDVKMGQIVIALTGLGGLLALWAARVHGRVDLTGYCLSTINGLLTQEQATEVDGPALRNLLSRHDRLRCLEDGWGNPIEVRIGSRDGRPVYTVISWGADGKPGPAQLPSGSDDPDSDWIRRDGDFIELADL